jgi:hypothetical protein
MGIVSGERSGFHDVCVEHHERQPAVTLPRFLQMKADDGLLLPILQPKSRATKPLCSFSVPASRGTCWR